MNLIFRKRILYNMFEGFFMKYVWSACGMLMIAIPVFTSEPKEKVTLSSDSNDENVSSRTQVSYPKMIIEI